MVSRLANYLKRVIDFSDLSVQQKVSPGLLLRAEITNMFLRGVATGDAGPGGEILVDCLPLLLEAIELQPGLVVVPSHHVSSNQQQTPAVGRGNTV